MNLVTAIIQPDAVDDVQIALHQHGINGMTLTEVSGYARQRGHTEVYRGDSITIDFTDKVKIEILCAGDEAWAVVKVICDAARTGSVGDGKVWISPVEDVVRIRTGERGDAAI
ncbi:nitrogen regulatory protein P-II family [Luteococcus japonicus]|uniref:Nitrogen regulatory protein P-II family n=1 Tax=Luteococcus japonicus TaxID=33984 RepID=A0A3N1ZV52_9ACTN|nr:P-II family nitrogen regulator [Luteococcus japonicus]ROR54337.1 nitrogen regulatory protein P-II family [Luteococcus japonicus]